MTVRLPKIVYLAGPMTGYPEFNFPAFLSATHDLRRRGYEVISPAEIDIGSGINPFTSPDGKLTTEGKTPEGHTFGDFLARDVKLIADEAEAVVVLPGWHKSRGARLEAYVALSSNKAVYEYRPSMESGILPLAFADVAEIVMPKPNHYPLYLKQAYETQDSRTF